MPSMCSCLGLVPAPKQEMRISDEETMFAVPIIIQWFATEVIIKLIVAINSDYLLS